MTRDPSFAKVPPMSQPRKQDRPFTATEVGTLIESFEGKLSAVAERVGSLCEDVHVLKTDVREIKDRLVTVEDTIRVSLPDIYRRITTVEAKVG